MLSKNEIKQIRQLHDKKGRKVSGLFIAEGEKLITELLQSDYEIRDIYALTSWIEEHKLNKTLQLQDVHEITGSELERISLLTQPNRVLAVVEQKHDEFSIGDQKRMLFLDEIKDPGNLGTIMRIADWFNIKTIICKPGSVEKYNPKAVQASMGSVFRVNCIEDEGLLPLLKSNGFKFYTADMLGISLEKCRFADKSLLILGSESHGVSEELKSVTDEFITIPKLGNAESLNVSVAAGIICYEMMK